MFNFFQKPKVEVKTEEDVNQAIKMSVSADEIIENYLTPAPSDYQDCEEKHNEKIAANEKSIKFLINEKESCSFENEAVYFSMEADRLIEENENLMMLKQQSKAEEKYPKIDLSFLSMKQKNKDDESRVTRFTKKCEEEIVRLPFVPRFSIHKLVEHRRGFSFKDCCIEIKSLIDRDNQCAISRVIVNVGFNFISENFIKVFVDQCLKKGILPASSEWTTWRVRDNSFETKGGWYDTDIKLTHKFIGVIPTKTKEKIKEVEKEFSEIYLVKECESWQTTVITKDPFIVGIIKDQAYLIDHFDCIDLEDYVRTQFSE